MRNFIIQYKNPIAYLALFFLALFLYTKLTGPIPFYVNSVVTQKQDLFSAEGTGEIFSVPDTAIVNAGVTSSGATVAEAQGKINSASKKVIEAIKKIGIGEKDIKTTNYSIYPNYGVSRPIVPLEENTIIDNSNQIIGYTASQNLEIKVRDIEKANAVVDAAAGNGANVLGNVSFGFTDEKLAKLENDARKEAVKNAKERAESLADAAGLRLGKVINVFESSSPITNYRALTSDKAQGGQPETEVTPGENSVVISVTISYEVY